jgi:plastocyanin
MRNVAGILLLGLIVLGSCSGDSSGISMKDQIFTPESFQVKAGNAVTFTNDSGQAHTVTAVQDGLPEGAEYFASGGFSSESEARDDVGAGLIDPGESFEVTLTEPGTYRFVCLPHENLGMRGTIVVER